ncbi:MAG: cytochrome P450 [Gammaproteobacteria bacterium]
MSTVTLENPRPLSALPGPRGWPLLGNFPQVDFREFHRQLERWADEFGTPYRFQLGPNQFVVISDVESAATVLRERPHLFGRRVALEHIFDELGFNGVFSADDDNWRRQRKIVITALNSSHLHDFFGAMRETTERLRRRWARVADEDRAVDLCAELMRYTVDVTTQLAFGIDFNTLETDGPVIQHHLDKVFPMLNRRLGAPFPYWRYVRFSKDRELDAAVEAIQAQIGAIIAQARQRIAATPSLLQEPTNFLEAMIAAKEAENLPFSDADIIANVFTLLLAGEDTTANTLAWAIKLFTDFPGHFADARAEVDAALGGATVPVHHQDIARLPLLEAFANETMRLKPVAPLTVSEAKAPIELAGVSVPAGTAVIMLSRYMATRPENFSRPEEFAPDRWLEKGQGETRTHNQKAFVPFGGGPRFCPGRNLALLEIKMVLAMLCRNFDVVMANGGQPVKELFAFTMSPTNLFVKFRHRAPRAD